MIFSQDMLDARLVGGVQAFLDDGPGNAYLLLYNGTQPAGGASAGGATLGATIVMASVSTVLAAHKLVFVQGDPSGDLIMNQISATWGRLMNGNNVWAADGSVSDLAGAGDFKISGTTGTLLYAGARAILGLSRLG